MDAPVLDLPAERRLRFGPFEVRPDVGELLRDGERIPIQQQPLKLLVCLLEKPGRIFPREELYERLWPTGNFFESREDALTWPPDALRVGFVIGDYRGALPLFGSRRPRSISA